MTEYSLRYFKEENKYYIEIRDAAYFELDRRLRRLKRETGRSGGTKAKSAVSPEARIALLAAKRESAQKYICVAENDLPPGMRARPLYKRPSCVTELSPENYRELLSLLASKNDPKAE